MRRMRASELFKTDISTQLDLLEGNHFTSNDEDHLRRLGSKQMEPAFRFQNVRVKVSSTTPVQRERCTKLSGEYVVSLSPGWTFLSCISSLYASFCRCVGRARSCLQAFVCRCESCIFILILGFAFLAFWTLFSIVGAIHYSKWHPRFDLKDVHIRSFHVTPARELSYDMDILIDARRFSPLRRIQRYSYKVRTSHFGTVIGVSSVPGFHPINNESMEVSTTQRVSGFPLGNALGDLVRKDLNATGRVAMRLYIEGQIYTPLFLAMKKRRGRTCDLIVSPGSPFGSQIVDRVCCNDFPCLTYGWVSSTRPDGTVDQTWSCKGKAPSCCQTPPADLRSTEKVC